MQEPFLLKTSRRSFMSNYIIGLGLLFYLIFTDAIMVLPLFLSFIFVVLISIFFLHPEGTIAYSNYHIKEENLVEVRGILAKKKIAIPYKSISNIIVKKGIIGRIFNFGDIKVNSFSSSNNGIILKGIKHPEKALELIEKFIQGKK